MRTSLLFKQISLLQLFYCLILGIVVRILVGHLPHSGETQPPIGGDYEAQRHWMEVTVHLPVREWYSQTLSNDLLYWGLDYPPLTAYVSRGIGLLAPKSLVRYRNSTLIAARIAAASKKPYVDGDEIILPITRERKNNKVDWLLFFIGGLSIHKWFMRASVIATDILVYFPAVLSIVHVTNILGGFRKDDSLFLRSLISWLLLPSLLLIDHGHFQYNGVMLGLVLAAVASLGYNNFLLSAFMFSLALNFKQMALYYAPVFFIYILSASLFEGFNFVILCDQHNRQRSTILQSLLAITTVGLVVICTFVFLWAPFCIFETPDGLKSITSESCIRGLSAVVYRIFPFSRNIFEDKVANIWCALEPVLRFRKWILTNPQDTSKIAFISTITTLLLCSPGLYLLFLMKRDNVRNIERENLQSVILAPSASIPPIPPIPSRAVTRNREKKRKASLVRAIELNLTNTPTLRRKSQRLSFQSSEVQIDHHEEDIEDNNDIGVELTTQESPTPILHPQIPDLINPFINSSPPPSHSSHSPLCMFEAFLLCLFLSSISFFLVSFQVHEKSILLPLIPLHALYHRLPLLSLWFTSMSFFSLWPLFVKDGLFSNITATLLVLGFLTNALNYPRTQIGNSLWPWYRAPSTPPFNYLEEASSIVLVIENFFGVQTARKINVYKLYTLVYRFALTMVIASMCLGFAAFYIPPPTSKPDIYPYLTAVLCAFNFAIIYVIALAVQYRFLKSSR